MAHLFCLVEVFGLSEGYWLRLQNTYDLMETHRNLTASALRKIKPINIQEAAAP